MGGDENGDFVFARQLQQRAPEHIAGGGIDTGGRFVKNQHFGVVQAGGGQLQALADAQGQRGGCGVGHLLQVKLLQCLVYRRFAAATHLIQLGVQLQVLAHTQFFIQRKRLRHITHAHFDVHAVRIDGLAKQLCRAFRCI